MMLHFFQIYILILAHWGLVNNSMKKHPFWMLQIYMETARPVFIYIYRQNNINQWITLLKIIDRINDMCNVQIYERFLVIPNSFLLLVTNLNFKNLNEIVYFF